MIPVFEKIWGYIDKNILPVLKEIGKIINEVAAPAFTWLSSVIQPIVGYFADLMGNVSGVVSWLEKLADKIKSIKIPSWAGGGGGADTGSGSSSSSDTSGSTPITNMPQSSQRTTSLRSTSVADTGAGTTVRIVFDAGALKKLITATIEETLSASGQQSFARMRTGN